MEEKEALKQTEVEPVEGLEALDKTIALIEERLRGENAKPSVADLMRLLELRRELVQAKPMPVTVRWIEEWPQIPDCEE